MLLEAVAEHNDELLMMYLEGEELPVETVKETVRKAVLSMDITPVFCGSAFKNKGVQQLLDGIVDYLPSPHDVPAMEGHKPRTEDIVTREADPDAPFAAIAFKIATDPYVGRLTFARVYSGTLNKGDALINANTEKKERAGRLLFMHANTREDVDSVKAGDICAIVGLKDTKTGDTLCDPDAPGRAGVHGLPRAGHQDRDRAQDQGRHRQAGRRAPEARRGGPDLQGVVRRRDGPDADRRHGRAPPRDHRGPPQARVQGRGQRRRAPGVVPRGHPQDGRPHLHAQEAVRRPRPVRARRDRVRARPSPAPRASSSSTRSRAARSRASSSRRSRRASGARSTRARSRATRWRPSRPASTTASSTTSTPTSSRSRSPAGWRSARPRAARARSSWSPS